VKPLELSRFPVPHLDEITHWAFSLANKRGAALGIFVSCDESGLTKFPFSYCAHVTLLILDQGRLRAGSGLTQSCSPSEPFLEGCAAASTTTSTLAGRAQNRSHTVTRSVLPKPQRVPQTKRSRSPSRKLGRGPSPEMSSRCCLSRTPRIYLTQNIFNPEYIYIFLSSPIFTLNIYICRANHCDVLHATKPNTNGKFA